MSLAYTAGGNSGGSSAVGRLSNSDGGAEQSGEDGEGLHFE
jgi:hypothetical protein